MLLELEFRLELDSLDVLLLLDLVLELLSLLELERLWLLSLAELLLVVRSLTLDKDLLLLLLISICTPLGLCPNLAQRFEPNQAPLASGSPSDLAIARRRQLPLLA